MSAERVARLEEAVRWVAQSVHQAHHEGPLESCARATCDYARQMLQPAEVEPRDTAEAAQAELRRRNSRGREM